MKLQHYIGGLEGLGAIDFETRVFVEPWETRIFGIHVAMMALSTHLDLPQTPSIFRTVWDLGGPPRGRGGNEPARLLQVPLL
jgi:nitrile hydratase subunit beta